MCIIGIPLSRTAYTPEAYAYEKYLRKIGYRVQLDYELDPQNDINIFFMGTRPFWDKKKGRAIEIHEYQSLSTPPYAKIKNYSKRIINSKPNGRIFLNNSVHQNLNFNDNIPYIYRDMGVDEAFFQKPNQNPEYDIIYCGSISGRMGLINTLLKLSENYKIVVVGNVTESEKKLLHTNSITLLGRVNREELPEIYRNARFGLNYTPNIYPFNIQTSTKTLEYLASGLGLIANHYDWIETFCKKNHIHPIWIGDDFMNIDLTFNSIKEVNMDIYKWESILKDCGFLNFIDSYLNI